MKKIAFVLSALFILSAFTFTHIDSYTANSKISKMVWYGDKLNTTHFGNIMLKSGTLKINHGKLVGGVFVIDMKSITNQDIESKNYNAMLVDDLKSDRFFDVGNFPEATFKLIRATPTTENNFEILGELNLKGKIGPVSFPLELKYENDGKVIAIGECSFNRTKFGLTYGSDSFFDNLGEKAISDIIRLEFAIVFEK
jgi:polyisoprenoid-binding protein YceI